MSRSGLWVPRDSFIPISPRTSRINSAGVQGLNNLITVMPKAAKSADVEERVATAIERMAHLDARSIWVTSTNGTVRLHGHVHSFSEKHTAGFVAASAPGVIKVENDVLVTP